MYASGYDNTGAEHPGKQDVLKILTKKPIIADMAEVNIDNERQMLAHLLKRLGDPEKLNQDYRQAMREKAHYLKKCELKVNHKKTRRKK